MFENISKSGATALLFFACLLAAPIASAMTVRPVVLDLKTSGRGMNQVISVQNTSVDAIPVELTAQELIIDAEGAHPTGKDPGDLVIFPPQAVIAPGATQTFRVQYVGDPALRTSKHYYITVAQLPVKLSSAKAGVQIVYNFAVLASVGPDGVKPSLHVSSAAIGKDAAGKPVPVITIANDSATYGYLAHGELDIVEKDSAGRTVFTKSLTGPEIAQSVGMGLVDPGLERKFTLPIALPSAAGTVSAEFKPAN